MGGDAILHHPGNSTRFDYINKACWAWYDIRTWSATNDVFKVGAYNYRRRCLSKKFCIMRQFWPFRIDGLILFLPCDKQRTSSTIVERYFHLTMRHSSRMVYWKRAAVSQSNLHSFRVSGSGSASRPCRLGSITPTWRPGTLWRSFYWNGTYYRQILGHVILPFSLCVFPFQIDFLFLSISTFCSFCQINFVVIKMSA